MHRKPYFPAHARQQIHHSHLVFEHHQGRDIAVLRKISVRIELAIQRIDVQRGIRHHRVGSRHIPHHGVTDMMHGAELSGHIPTSPAMLHRGAVVDMVIAQMAQRGAIGSRVDRAHQQTWHAERMQRFMAREAGVVPLKTGLRDRPLIQRVEDQALYGILRRGLYKLLARTHAIATRSLKKIVRGFRGPMIPPAGSSSRTPRAAIPPGCPALPEPIADTLCRFEPQLGRLGSSRQSRRSTASRGSRSPDCRARRGQASPGRPPRIEAHTRRWQRTRAHQHQCTAHACVAFRTSARARALVLRCLVEKRSLPLRCTVSPARRHRITDCRRQA